MSRLYLSLLGGISITLDNAAVTHFRSDKARALFLYLAVEKGQAHRRETLSGLFWGNQTSAAASHNLSQALVYLQQSLGKPQVAEFLDISRTVLQFKRDSEWWMDADELVALRRVCQAHKHRSIETCPACLVRLRQAAELYRGEFLPQVFLDDSPAFEEWLVVKREYFLRQAMISLGHLVAHYEQQGPAGLDQTIHYARRAVELEPWREEPYRALMRALAARGEIPAAVAYYQSLEKILSEEVGVVPSPETNALYKHLKQVQGATIAGALTLPGDNALPIPSNLPLPLTPLVGRNLVLAQLTEQIARADCRMLTLLGAGGMGKTRLAIQLAREKRLLFPGGTWFVDLADVGSPDLIPGAIAAALQFNFQGIQSPQEQIVAHLRDIPQDFMLVLDNFEQLLSADQRDGAGLLDEILKRVPRVTLLVTSREKLNLQGEWVFDVEGLDAPTMLPAHLGADWDSSEAVQLFVQCAVRAGSAAARWSEPERRAAMRATQLVEGMPLAIELAAAWVRTIAPTEIAEEIEKGLDILVSKEQNVPRRHASIRAVFEQSWQLLTASEQHVFAQLSVFRGGFTREAVRELAGASLGILAGLVDKSLVKRTASGRYRLHELVRQFAAQKLALSESEGSIRSNSAESVLSKPKGPGPGESKAAQPNGSERTRERHSKYYLDLLCRYGEQLNGTEARLALDGLRHELENLRTAWSAALERSDTGALLRALPYLANFFEVAGLGQEGELFFRQSLATWEGKNQALEARLYAYLALFRHQAGNYDQAIAAAQAAVELGQATNDLPGQALAQEQWGVTLYRQFQFGQAREHLERALPLARTAGLPAVEASAGLWLANVFESDADYATAEQMDMEALRIAERIGDQRLTSRVLSELARIANRQFHYGRAAEFLERALFLKRMVGDPYGEARVLINLGVCMLAQNRLDVARRYQLQALQLVQEIGDRAGTGVMLVNLAEGSLWMGDYPQALGEYQDAFAIGRELQQRWVEFTALWGLGMVYHLRGENHVAAPYAQDYLERTHAAAIREDEGRALVLVAHIAGALGDVERAARSYRAAATLLSELGQSNYALDAVGGLAALALQQGNLQQALDVAETLDARFDTIASVFDIEPFRVFMTCYHVFRVCDAGRAEDFLDRVYRLLETRALAIEDEQVRRMYLENVPWHRELVHVWRQTHPD